MRRDLALDASPALAAPLRFFLNAPVFGMIAAGLLGYAGPSAFYTRWSAFALAATHVLTLGVFASVMIGALIQILPVVAGAHVAAERTSATGIHALLSVGTLALAAAFVTSHTILFSIAALACGAACCWFVVACLVGLRRAREQHPSGVSDILRAIRLALIAFAVTVALGAALALSLAHPFAWPIVGMTNVHLIWGLAGWIGLLTAGVAYQVIPMFLVTEPYPRRLAHAFAPLSLMAIALASVSVWYVRTLALGASLSLAALPFVAYGVFAVVTLALLHGRKRSSPDTTTLYWRTSMVSVLGASLAWAGARVTGHPSLDVALGVLVLVGAIQSAISGMLYKIVPFLLWYHLQATLDVRSAIVPKVKAVLPDEHARAQYWAHLCALALLLCASALPNAFTRPAALALGISSAWLGVNIARALRLYLSVKCRLTSVSARGTQL
ncbi:hypothetical protein AB1286_11195 [Trinickia sp. NRRL B-1857]|uniref:hypothetical protein n=1 Tax=Trinickia sp. NRRL B-1857 TaxID=3162879 RepID=UPI003D2BC937